MDNDYRIEDFPKEGDINWREFAEHFGIETALKFLDLYGGQKIWVLSPSNQNTRKPSGETQFDSR